MKKIIEKKIGKKNYFKLERLKKRFFPTKYDKGEKQFLEEQIKFYAPFIKPNTLCFDIGGNVGFKTNVFLHLKAKVVTVEPQADCVEILNAKYGQRAIILQKGVGAFNEVKEFYVSDNSQLSSFDKGWLNELQKTRFADSKVRAVEKVEIVTLDSLIEIYGTPNFIKIDVEGYELEVFKGLNKSFGILSFEYAVPERLNEVVSCLQLLKDKYVGLACNYSCGNHCDRFVLEKWMSIAEMLMHVQLDSFSRTFAGDIYIKNLLIN